MTGAAENAAHPSCDETGNRFRVNRLLAAAITRDGTHHRGVTGGGVG
jgi:hypothetical protein